MRVFICVCVVASATWSAITCSFGPHIFSEMFISFEGVNVVPTIQCRPTHGSVRCHVDYNRKRLIARRYDSGLVRLVVCSVS